MLASLRDVLVASTTATVGLPEVDAGVVDGAGHLARLVPNQWVQVALTGGRVSAQQLLALGGLTEVVAPDELRDAALRVTDTIAAERPAVVRMTKDALCIAEDVDLEHGHRLKQV